MKFVVATYGTEGDVRPLAALCRALMDAGHEATLLADRATLGIAQTLDVPARALSGDIKGTLDPSAAISNVVGNDHGLNSTAKALAGIANANAETWLREIVDAAEGSDALIVSALAAFVGLSRRNTWASGRWPSASFRYRRRPSSLRLSYRRRVSRMRSTG